MARGLIHRAQIRAAPRPRYRDCGEYTSKQVRSGGANTVELLISRNVSCPGHLKRGSCARVVLPWGSSECPPSSPRAFFLPSVCPWSPRNVQVGNLAHCPGIAPPSLSPAHLLFGRHRAGLNHSGLFWGRHRNGLSKIPYRSRTCSATLCGCLIAGWHSQW